MRTVDNPAIVPHEEACVITAMRSQSGKSFLHQDAVSPGPDKKLIKSVTTETIVEQQQNRLLVDITICVSIAAATSLLLLSIDKILLMAIPIALAALLFAFLRWREQMALIRYIQKTSYIDQLTDIINRSGMEKILGAELERVNRYQSKLSILLIDIDNFRSINDLYSHQVGNRVIQHIAAQLTQDIRGADKVGRLDGGMFMAILPETGVDMAVSVAERIRQQILDYPLMDDGEALAVSVSIGTAESHAEIAADNLFYHAYQALTIAKKQGKNQVHSWQTH